MKNYKDALYDLIEEDEIDGKVVAQSLLYWCDENLIKRWCIVNEVFPDEEVDGIEELQ